MNIKQELPEIKHFVNKFVDDNWGNDRAKSDVDLYGSRLTIDIVIVDDHGRADNKLLTQSMKNEMRYASKDLIEQIERKFGIEMEQISLSGNLIGLEVYLPKTSSINEKLVKIAKSITATNLSGQAWQRYKRQNRIQSSDEDIAESAFYSGYDSGYVDAEKDLKGGKKKASIVDNDVRPPRMKKPVVTSAAHRKYTLYVQDLLEDILIDKYGTRRGQENFEYFVNKGGGAFYAVGQQIEDEKSQMYLDLGEKQPSDYFHESYFKVWQRWMKRG